MKAIFTRVEPCDKEEKNKLSQMLGYPVAAVIPNEYMLVSQAANNGQMALRVQPDTMFAQTVNRLAADIIGEKTHIRWGNP